MAIAGGIGATIDQGAVVGPAHAFFFGEDQGRYVVTAKAEDAPAILAAAAQGGRRGGADRRDRRRRAARCAGEAPIAIAALEACARNLAAALHGRPGGELA